MARIRLDLRRDPDGQARAVFSKGAGSFSLPVGGVKVGDPRWALSDAAGDRRDAEVRPTTLREFLKRQP